MARSRNIKPGFFTNDSLAELPALTRLFFVGLWTLADRDGRIEDRPRKLKAECMPYDDMDADAALSELQSKGFVQRYEADGVRCMQIVNWCKHQNPHMKEAESTLPAMQEHQTSTVQATDKQQPSTERAGLIPDSGFLIPDSSPLIPDSSVAPAALSGKAPRKRGAKPVPDSAAVWASYSEAYERRYSVHPVRNASVNAHLAQLVGKLGAAEAPFVAAHFVKSQNGLYVAAMHPTNLLLRDAEKLRTEWATGRQVTRTQAQQADRTQTNANAFDGLLAAAEMEYANAKS